MYLNIEITYVLKYTLCESCTCFTSSQIVFFSRNVIINIMYLCNIEFGSYHLTFLSHCVQLEIIYSFPLVLNLLILDWEINFLSSPIATENTWISVVHAPTWKYVGGLSYCSAVNDFLSQYDGYTVILAFSLMYLTLKRL